ncbi:MAG: hypothetical protein HC876_15885 [Chloroflexaceae bacterium]|nr:hypothetical protein [Chloroflexaceae bacterium]
MTMHDQSPVMPLAHEALRQLAAHQLTNYRQSRFEGGGLRITVEDFEPADQIIVYRLYNVLGELFDLLKAYWNRPDEGVAATRAFTTRVGWIDFLKKCKS